MAARGFSWTSPGRLQGMGVLAKVWPDTYKEWLRRVRSGLCDFGLSYCPPMPLTRYPIRSGCASEMDLPTSIYVSMVCRWRPPVWQSAQDTIIFFLGPARPRQPSQLSPASQAAFFNITFNFFLEPARPVMYVAHNACMGCAAIGNTSSTHVSQSC